MLRGFFGALLIFLTVAASSAAQAGPAPDRADWQTLLAQAVRRATVQNPRVHEAEARAAAARHRVPQAAALPDPEVELGLKDVPVRSPSLTRDDFTMEMVTGRQRLPGRGKRSAMQAAERAGVESAGAMREREVVEIAADTADAFFQLAETDRSLAILEDAAMSTSGVAPSGKSGEPGRLLRRALLLWVVAGLALNFTWEMLQRPLYSGQGSFEQDVWQCFFASLWDVGLVAGLYVFLSLVTREHYWFLRLGGGRLLLLAAAGFALAVLIEWRALGSGKWGYAPEMPRVPGLGVGWSPVLQMVLIPLALAWLSHAWARRMIREDDGV